MYTIYVDGGSNNATIGETCFIVTDNAGKEIAIGYHYYEGKHTNNQMEYKALIHSLAWIKENTKHRDKIRIKTDSQLVKNQVNGDWKVRDVHIKRAIQVVNTHLSHINKVFERAHLLWVPRSQNLAGKELEIVQRKRKARKNKRSSS